MGSRWILNYLAGFLVGIGPPLAGYPSVLAGEPPANKAVELLPPTGPLSLGRTSFHWVDAAGAGQERSRAQNAN